MSESRQTQEIPIPSVLSECPEVEFLPLVLVFFYAAFEYLPDGLIAQHADHLTEKVRQMEVLGYPIGSGDRRVEHALASTRRRIAGDLFNLFRRTAMLRALGLRLLRTGEPPTMISQKAVGMAHAIEANPELLTR
jgi:hypothetical protein